MATIGSELFLVHCIAKEVSQLIPDPLNIGFFTLIKDSYGKERRKKWA